MAMFVPVLDFTFLRADHLYSYGLGQCLKDNKGLIMFIELKIYSFSE